MALSVEITRIMPLYPNGVFLQWDLTNPTEAGTYTFNVFRGAGNAGPWEPLLVSAANVMNYVDKLATSQPSSPVTVTPNLLSTSRSLLYRVTATPPSGDSNTVEAVSQIEPKLTGRQRLIRRKMIRDESVLLRKINGTEVALLKRMHWGPRCLSCFDKYSKEVVRANCTSCYGTGFLPGYHLPIVTMARRGTGPIQTSITPQGKSDQAGNPITMLDTPDVEAGDVLVFLRENKRFLVQQQIQTELQTVSVHQKLMVVEIPRSSIEYRIPCDPLRVPSLF